MITYNPTGRARYLMATVLSLASGSAVEAQLPPVFEIEVEAGPVWQTRNNVQIPNDPSGTRFSLVDLVGRGPWPTGRLYVTWNINSRHGLSALLAPLSVTETGVLDGPVSFAGTTFQGGSAVEGTYRFNSWRLGYRYRAVSRPGLDFWVGLTAKLRDAEIRLRQGGTSARDTDLGFVPLVHLGADWRPTPRGHVLFDVDGLAGGPGRAFDASLKLGYDLSDRWRVSAGYRTLEGGADVDSVYNFAWLHYGAFSVSYRR